MLERRWRWNITSIRLRRRAHTTQRRRRRCNHPLRSSLSLSLLSFSLFLFLNKRFVCVCNVSSYSTNLSLEYLFRLSFWHIWNKNIQKKNEWLLTASFIFRVLKIFQKRLKTVAWEKKKRKSHVPLSSSSSSLFFVSLSRCCFFALSSNARSWEDKGKRNEMIFWTMGARDSLWDVVVKWDDICFKHILPRLNRTDVKFLYGVNSETRKLIKRSSRARDLK